MRPRLTPRPWALSSARAAVASACVAVDPFDVVDERTSGGGSAALPARTSLGHRLRARRVGVSQLPARPFYPPQNAPVFSLFPPPPPCPKGLTKAVNLPPPVCRV